jgi:hypothetical protein
MKLIGWAVAATFLIALMQAAMGACLSMEYDGIEDHWVNHCAVEVGVNWTDAGACKDWACSGSVPPKGRRAADKFIGSVKWCECQGAACKVQGPC